jgi:hypothetical protein
MTPLVSWEREQGLRSLPPPLLFNLNNCGYWLRVLHAVLDFNEQQLKI